jgi:enoyl-CoA hydratase
MTDLLVDDADGARTIAFNRPTVQNALTRVMREELCALLDAADRDPSVRVVIVTGTDPAFCAGVDFRDMDPQFDPRERRFTVNPGRALRAMRKPVISAVNGACISGGLEIALSSSFIVASERAAFADTHARLDVLPAWGLTALLPRAVGLRKAREMSATGVPIDAAEAFRLGMVNHVVTHEELLPLTRELAGRVTDTAAMRTVFGLYEQGVDLALEAALSLEMTTYAHRPWSSADFAAAGEQLIDRDNDDETTR